MRSVLLAACAVFLAAPGRAQHASSHRYEAADPDAPASSARPSAPSGSPRVIRVTRPGGTRVEANSLPVPGEDGLPASGNDAGLKRAGTAAAANSAPPTSTPAAGAAGRAAGTAAKGADAPQGVTVPLPNGRSCTAPFLPAAFLALPRGPGGALPFITHFYDAKTFNWEPYGDSPRCLVSSGGAVTVIPLSANVVILPEGVKGPENDPGRPRYVVHEGGNSTGFWPKGYVPKGTPGYRYWTDSRPYLPPDDLENMTIECAGLNCYWHATAPNGYNAGAHPDSQARFAAWSRAGFPTHDATGCVLDVRGEYITWNGVKYCDGKAPFGPVPDRCRWTYKDYCFNEDTPGDPREGAQGIVRVAVGTPECTAAPREGYSLYKGTIYWKSGDPDKPEACPSGMSRMSHSSIDEDLKNERKSAAAASPPPAGLPPPASVVAPPPAESVPATPPAATSGGGQKPSDGRRQVNER